MIWENSLIDGQDTADGGLSKRPRVGVMAVDGKQSLHTRHELPSGIERINILADGE